VEYFASSTVAGIDGFEFIEKGESNYAMMSPLLCFVF
jgi:hypothetical protein